MSPTQPELRQLADGVFAWIGAGGDSNGGAIATPDGVIVIDAQQTAALGRAMRQAVEKALGKPPSVLVTTHYHFDHITGNVAFAGDAPILAHERTLQKLEARLGPDSGSPWIITDMHTKIGMFYGENIGELIPEGDPAWEWFENRFAPADYDRLEIVPPTQTFADRFTFHLPDDRVELEYFGPAHCDGDIIVHLPRSKIVFLSDLFFYGRFPWLGDCDLNGWISVLDHILTLDLEIVVPGHGVPGTLKDVAWFRDLLANIRKAVEKAIKAGVSEEAVVRETSLPEYADISRYDTWLPFNLRSAYRYLNRGDLR
jgi:cyclase